MHKKASSKWITWFAVGCWLIGGELQQAHAEGACAKELLALKAEAVPFDDYLAALTCLAGEKKLPELFADAFPREGDLSSHVFRVSDAGKKSCLITGSDPAGVYVLTGAKKNCVAPKGKPIFESNSAFAYLLLHKLIDGHREVTQAAVTEFCKHKTNGCTKPSAAALKILSDAAEDADYYEWGHPWAHAQTPQLDGKDSILSAPDDAEKHEARYRRWVMDQLANAKRLCTQKKPDWQGTLYFLGYAMHAVEDLASHRGRTNAEHRYVEEHPALKDSLVPCEASPPDTAGCVKQQAEPCGNPDADICNVELGKLFARLYLADARAYLNRGPVACFDEAFKQVRVWAGPITKLTKNAYHGHGWDFSLDAVNAYRKQGRDFAALDEATRKKQARRWFTPETGQKAMQRLSAELAAPGGP